MMCGTLAGSTINWSASVDHGFSLQDGTELPAGSLVRLGYFRNPVTLEPMTDAQIQILKANLTLLNTCFVEADRTSIGTGFTPAIAGHFTATTTLSPDGLGGQLADKQIYLWVLNAATVGAATQHAILYWDIADSAAHPDGGDQDRPGASWRFPSDSVVPGQTTIDLTDLTQGTGALASGARVVVGFYTRGVSSQTNAANFGLAELEQPLQVVQPGLLVGATVGYAYSQSLSVIEGRPNYTWEISGGSLPHGLSMNAAGLISGVPSFAGSSSFVVIARDSALRSVSASFTIVVAEVPLVIASEAQLPPTGEDAVYARELIAQGGTKPYSWSLVGGTLPTGLNLDAQGNLTGTPTTAGSSSFQIKCTDSGGQSVSRTFSLDVLGLEIVTAPTLNAAILNRPFLQRLEARGGAGPYNWSLAAGSALPPGAQLSAQGDLTFVPALLASHNFELQVADNLGHIANRTFTLPVLGSAPRSAIETPLLAPVMVGEVVRLQLAANNRPTRFAVQGLPSGLVVDPLTGLITGKPRVSGSFPLKIIVSNLGGDSVLVVDPGLEVSALPAETVGSYIGVIAHNTGLNGNLGGRVDLTVTQLGGYSLRLNQGGRESTHAGELSIVRGAAPRLELTRAGAFKLELSLEASSNLMQGKVTNLLAAAGGSSASISGWRNVWKPVSNPASSRSGYYTMGIDVMSPILGNPVPEGTGFARTVVGVNGLLNFAGKMADGSALTTAGFIGPNGEALLYQLLYGRTGSVVGRVAIAAEQNSSDNVVAGLLTWIKPAGRTRVYPNGFGPLTMGVYGGYLAAGLNSLNLVGMLDPDLPAALNFAGGGVEDSVTNPDVPQFTYVRRGPVLMPPPGAPANPASATLSIPYDPLGLSTMSAPFTARRTGYANATVVGGFKLRDVGPGGKPILRNVAFEGMIIRGADSNTRAYGFFLLPQLPVAGQTLNTSPILSGQMTISQ